MLFTMQEPFYGIILSSMERIPYEKVETLGVTQSGNVFKLLYNPAFIATLTVDQTLELLKHEILHLAFNHFSLWGDGKPSENEAKMRNIAADMEVNGYLNKSVLRPLNLVLAENFGWEDQLGTREYYNKLQNRANPPQRQTAQNSNKPCNGGQGGSNPSKGSSNNSSDDSDEQDTGSGHNQGQDSTEQYSGPSGASNPVPQQPDNLSSVMSGKGEQLDDHTLWPYGDSQEQIQNMTQQIEDMLVMAATEVEKSCGNIPGEMRVRIEEIRKKRPRPVADWKRYFRRYLGNEFTEFIRKSKKRESRRFPDAAGNRHRRKSHILVGIDTSGSISMPEYQEFFGQIRTLTASADFHVVECDAVITHEYDFKGHPNMNVHGGGGTSFCPVIDKFIAERKKYDALVYFTDGEATIPRNTPKETLWVISSKGDQSDKKRYKVNGASVVFIPSK